MTRLTFKPSSWLTSPPPSVGLSITPDRITGVTIDCRDGAATIVAHAVADLAGGAVVPSLTGKNIVRPDALHAALEQVFSRLPVRPKRVAVALPDAVAKVSLIRFDKVPDRQVDLDQLVKWQMRKTAPFPLDEAQVAYTAGLPTSDGGREFVVAVARRDVILEYEHACANAGAHAGALDIAALGLIDAAVVGDRVSARPPAGDWLLVHLSHGWCTLAIVRHEAVIFFRSRGLEGEENLADLVHQTAMYYEDRLGGSGFARVLIADATGSIDAAARRDLESRLATTAALLDPRHAAALADRGSASADMLAALAAPLGVTLREWVA